MTSFGMLGHVVLTTTHVFLRRLLRLLITFNVVSSSLILVTLMMEAIRSSETSVDTRATWRNIPEDDIGHSERHENLKSYKPSAHTSFQF
jgi:hypothetical protein